MFRISGAGGNAAFLFEQKQHGDDFRCAMHGLVLLPFFLFALYEKNGQTLEVILGNLIQCKLIRPKQRIYQTNNSYSALVRQANLEKEVRVIAEKSEKMKNAPKRKLTRSERKQIEAIIQQANGNGTPHTVQDSIPFQNIYPDGLCRLDENTFSKTIEYEDVNYRLAEPDDQRDIFEHLCDFYNSYDPSIGAQMTLCSRPEAAQTDRFGMAAHGDALDDLRREAAGILQKQYEKGSNGYVKSKYVN